MAAYYCQACDIAFPKAKLYNDCPLCETSTVHKMTWDPIPDAEARRYEQLGRFNRWCKANGRADSDPPLTPRLFLPRDHTPHDGRIAWTLLEALEDLGQLPELHVVMSGLVPGVPRPV